MSRPLRAIQGAKRFGRQDRYLPDRGDLVWLNFAPRTGHEQSGKRPAMILSPAIYNRKTGLALCCPITSQVKGYPFEVLLPANCATHGAILSDHVKNLDWRARSASFIEKISDDIVSQVVGKLSCLIKG